MRAAAWGLAAAVLVACARPVAPVGGGCAGACARIRECGLGRAQTVHGALCEDVCENASREGVDWGAACLIAAKTCEEARACP